MPRFAWLCLAGVAMAGPLVAEVNWPSFRGPSGQGWSNESRAPLTWSEDQGVTWKTAIPGRGWSSPVAWGDQIWVTTAIEEQATAEQKAARIPDEGLAGQRQLAISVSLQAVCLDRASGQITKNVELFQVKDPESIHTLNSYASPTPVIEEGRIYCHFGTFGTACVDTRTGEVIWRCQLPTQHAVGPGSSPILWRHLLVLVCDGMDAQYVAALHKETGEIAWKHDRPAMTGDNGDFHKAFSTPLAVSWNGQEQLIIPGAQWFVGHDPETGELLWWLRHGEGFSNVAAPAFADGIAYLITGFTSPELWAVPVSRRGELNASNVLWEQQKQVPKKSSPLLAGQEIYLISDNGVLSCVDVNTGEICWSHRLGGNYSASPIIVEGRIYLCSHEGKTIVFQPQRKDFELLAENRLDGQLMASPLPSDGALYIRSDKHLYRIEGN